MFYGTLSMGTVQFCMTVRVSVIVYVFNPLWKWSRLGMLESKFLAYVLITTHLSGVTRIIYKCCVFH